MKNPIHAETRIGHIHLRVADIERSLAFYQDLLGFQITSWYGKSAVFLSAGGYHHHIGLNTWSGPDIGPAPKDVAGLFHHAILYPNRKELANVLKNLLDTNYLITGFADHGVSEAIYLDDPDGIGVELYTDRPKEEWPKNEDGSAKMTTDPLDVENLLLEIKE